MFGTLRPRSPFLKSLTRSRKIYLTQQTLVHLTNTGKLLSFATFQLLLYQIKNTKSFKNNYCFLKF